VVEDVGSPEIGDTCVVVDLLREDERKFRIMLDCGLLSETVEDGKLKYDTKKMERRYELLEEGVDAIVLSHAHMDHSNGLPFLFWFWETNLKTRGVEFPRIITHRYTQELFERMQISFFELPPEKDWAESKHKAAPFIARMRRYFHGHFENSEESIEKGDYECRIKIMNAGHIVGSSMAEIKFLFQEKLLGRVLYTGDFCPRDASFLVEPCRYQMLQKKYDAIILENTYLMNAKKKAKRKEIKQHIKKLMDEVLRDGNLIFVCYGIDRIQNVLVCLQEIMDCDEYWAETLVERNTRGEPLIYLDTAIGEEVSSLDKEFMERVARNPDLYETFFRRELRNRALNGKRLFEIKEHVMYTFVNGTRARARVIREHRAGLEGKHCIVLCTSAFLTKGSPVNAYLRFWGDDDRNVFVLAGYPISERAKKLFLKKEEIDLGYWWYFEDEREARYVEDGSFAPRGNNFLTIDDLSAHADGVDLQGFIGFMRRRTGLFVHTHIGEDPWKAEVYLMSRFGKKHVVLTDEKVVDGRKRAIKIELKPTEEYIAMEPAVMKKIAIYARRYGTQSFDSSEMVNRTLKRVFADFDYLYKQRDNAKIIESRCSN